MVDLHVHSTCSDGTFTPTQLVDHAIELGISAFALTDHDSVSGIAEALSYANALKEAGKPSVEVIPGIELSTDRFGSEVHVVGLYIDPQNESFLAYLQDFINSREVRNKKMCEKLAENGVFISYEELCSTYPNAVLTRAHYAKLMMQRGYVSSIREAFDRYLGNRCSCYVPREKITPMEAVKLILSAGGIPILAHPILYRLSDTNLKNLVQTLTDAGLMGIEAIYSSYTPSEERQIRKLAQEYHLLLSGGSDFHGANKPGLEMGIGYGKLYVHEEILETIKKCKYEI